MYPLLSEEAHKKIKLYTRNQENQFTDGVMMKKREEIFFLFFVVYMLGLKINLSLKCRGKIKEI
jgi:hypothetical protein